MRRDAPLAASMNPTLDPRAAFGRRISASRRAPAVSRRRGDSFPGIMAVGGFFLDFEPIRAATGSVFAEHW